MHAACSSPAAARSRSRTCRLSRTAPACCSPTRPATTCTSTAAACSATAATSSTAPPSPDEAPDWTAYDPFTPEQIDEIGAAVDQALAADLPDQVPAGDPPTPDAARATFTLRGRPIAVGEYPKAAPAELERILDLIARLRKRTPVPSTWRIWSDGAVVELEARCEIGEVPALSPLRDAIFMPTAPPGGRAAGDDPPKDTPLVSIAFAAPKGEERLEVFADGRRVDTTGGREREQELDADRMAAIRAAVEQTDWAALPSRLC